MYENKTHVLLNRPRSAELDWNRCIRSHAWLTNDVATRDVAASPHFAPSTMTGRHRFFSDRFRRLHNNRTFIFVDTFGFPFFYSYPYPYYGYYPYPYYGYSDYGYGYGNARVIEVQRRLARAGYYHGAIDGIMGPQTRRAIRAYERDHNMPAYGVIDGQRLTIMSLV
jgi:hypothetical protein